MSNLRLKLHVLCFVLMMSVMAASAQSAIRYVDCAKLDNTGDGTSWGTAKKDIQEAINDLVNNNLTGEVWVKGSNDAEHPAVYYPTETTESSGSEYYKAFKIPAGITVRGGFKGDEENASERVTIDDKNFGAGVAKNGEASGNLDGEEAKSGVYEYKTILCGDLRPSKVASLVWNKSKQQFNTTFYGNSYHVVWFAMNGFNSEGRANPLTKPAKLEGCVVKGGHAYTSDAIKTHPHEGYGGGIYMVANSFVYNCEVKDCDAARNGGGIYMDGGGIVRRTLVHNCQALGLGTDYGYGGGICEDGYKTNSKSNPIVVAQSVVTNCVGRMGGGMALLADQTIGDNKYAIVANSTLVNNNTATIEAGGVYTYKGGGLASMTVVRNKCNGSGITQNGQITGRSGGVYSRDASYIGNTVIWGNECEANKDIQYADSRSSLSDTEKTKFYYSALSNADIADWSKSEKMGVLSLDNNNKEDDVSKKGSKGYPLFENPTDTAGYSYKYFERSYAESFDWKVYSESALHHAGINTADLDHDGLTPAPQGESYDMQFGVFNSRCTMGAIVSEEPIIDSKNDLVAGEAHFFVDPSYNFAHHHDDKAKGQSWTTPTRFLGNVLEYINADRKKAVGEQEYANLTIFIHVKEGTVDNTDSYKSGRVRTTSLDIPSDVTILGSYDKSLTGTDLSKRNPVTTPTIISGKLLDNYKYYIAHLIYINKASNVTLDGFKITLANAYSTELANENRDGAAIMLKDCKKDSEGNIDIHFKNIIISNCYGNKGTVVYSDNSSADFENCIFHNNTTAAIANSGLIYGIKSDLRFDHCNVLRSVGHASYLDAATHNVWKNSMFYGNLDRAQDNTNSSEFSIEAFEGPGVNASNLTGERCMFDKVSRPLYDKSGASIAGYAYTGNGVDLGVGVPAQSTYYKRTESKGSAVVVNNPNGLEYSYTSGWANGYPRMVNPTKNAGYSTEGDITYYGRATSFEPHNDNPVVNAAGVNDNAHDSWGYDITTVITRDFGGRPDIGAVESHIATSDQIANENGNPDGQMPYGVAYYVRDYAQLYMPMTYKKTSTGYVRMDGTDGNTLGHGNYVRESGEEGSTNDADYAFLDGASWQYAVSGNANYGLSVDINTPVNTNWQAVKDTSIKIFNGKFKIRSGNNYLRLTVSNRTATLTTGNEGQASEWTVSDISTDDANLAGTHTISTTVNGTTYYLYSYNSGNTNSRNFTIAKSGTGNGYTLQYTGMATVYIRYNNGLTYTTSTNQATAWTFDPQYTLGGWIEQAIIPSGKTGYDRDQVTGTVKNEALDLHVYSSKTDVDNLGDAVVSYKIKLAGSELYAYDRANNNHNLRSTTLANAHDFVLISAGVKDEYYIYDLNTKRYVYNNNNSSIRLRETNPTPWYVILDAGNNSFNIALSNATNANAWNNAGTTNDMNFAARNTNANQEWVFVPNKNYTNKYYNETHTVGEQLNGLQYAVNTVYEEYLSKKIQHQIHVAEGTYTNRTGGSGSDAQTDKDKNLVSQPYAYMMQEGVDVLGGYPTVGNPGEEQRQPKTFETILQPSANNPYVPMTFTVVDPGKDQGYDYMKVEDGNWNVYVKKNNAEDAASFARVLVQPVHFKVQTLWDGFTIRNGYLNTAYSEKIGNALANLSPAEVRMSGGAGVLLQENGIIENCVVKDNVILIAPNQIGGNMIQTGTPENKSLNSDNIYTFITGGAGVFMSATMNVGDKTVKGVGGIVRNCQIYENQLIAKAYLRTGSRPDNVWQFGAGLYQNGGDVFNTIVHDNYAVTVEGTTLTGKGTGSDKNNEMMLGAGVFVSQGNFYNNTIVNNTACTYFQNHDNHCSFGGVHVFENATIYNSLIAGNAGHWSYESWNSGTNPGNGVPVSAFEENSTDRFSRDKKKVHVKYSFVDVKYGETANVKKSDGTTVQVDVDLVSYNDTQGNTGAVAPYNTNIYKDKNPNVSGTVDYSDLTKVYYPKGNAKEYQLVDGVTVSPCINTGTTSIWDPIAQSYVVIPDVDAFYTDRIKDCKIDIGAFESDGAATIQPQAVGDKQLVFYVTPEGYGKTDGSDPANAACAPKLQKVIDAAGRYKLQNPGKQVIVKVANSYDLHDAEGDDFTYYATRTTDQTSTDTRMWSIQIPRGVEVWGGYTDVPVDADWVKTADTWDNEHNGFVTSTGADHRNITKNPTYFNSYFYNKDMRINATTYHVVTFTDRIYDVNGVPFLKTDLFKFDSQGKIILVDGKAQLKDGINLSTTLSTAVGNDETDKSRFAYMSEIIGTANVMAEKIDGKTVSNRAVLDGIFVTGGNADGKALSGSSNLNANGYGGAAIVTDYAYVRNCILKNNSATNGGGLALTNGAFVSGSLIVENNADNMGGGLYVFENGATLSNGIKINTTAPEGQQMDINMAHVFTSTIVANTAQQGGGIWYTEDLNANARFNSVAVWQNEAADQANVFGMVNPEQPTDDETLSEIFYPFAYSLIQNVRASGTNNLDAMGLNSQGVRFVNKNHDVGKANVDQHDIAEEKNESALAERLSDFGYYGLTTYSMLCSNGMPKSMYNTLKEAIAISDVDILNTDRINAINTFVEIGARALPKLMPNNCLMLRLFVSHPEYVDTETATRFMRLKETDVDDSQKAAARYYSQMGSSFAYPFNFLQDAIDYIKRARNGQIAGLKMSDGSDATSDIVRNLPFEIVLGTGTYYPKQGLNSQTASVWSATFAIPEGVTIIGGFYPRGGVITTTTEVPDPEHVGETLTQTETDYTYYGRYYKKGDGYVQEGEGDIYKYVDPIPNTAATPGGNEIGRGNKYGEETVTLPAVIQTTEHAAKEERLITFQQWHIQDIADRRAMRDNNNNGIVEPWEFANQTIISGNAVNGETDGVYHIMTAIADADAVGLMPKVQSSNAPWTDNNFQVKEEGQQIRLNGLIVTGGNALTYLATALDSYGANIYYQGAGLQVDGNRYNTTLGGTPTFYNPQAYGVGYRDIPVSITNCQFRNNIAGYGGAISSNGSLSLFASSFEQNMALAQTETSENGNFKKQDGTDAGINKVMYPGQGGAILATHQLSAFNTLFANNEARLADGEEPHIDAVLHPSFRVPNPTAGVLRAAGGAIMMGFAGKHHIVNCDFVRNKANMYPAVFTLNPTVDQNPDYDPANPVEVDTHEYSQIINTVAWQNEVDPDFYNKFKNSNAEYAFASKLFVNVGKKDRTTQYVPGFGDGKSPASQEDLDGTAGNWQEAVWFSAYEKGTGFTPNNENDLRDAIIYSPLRYAVDMIRDANVVVVDGVTTHPYQNCNLEIVEKNDDVAGPNFGNPSVKSGFEGFMEGADWSPSRFNRLTDNGNGWIRQDVTIDNVKKDYVVTFHNDEGPSSVVDGQTVRNYQGAYTITHYISDLTDDKQFPEYKLWLALGNEKYMQATNDSVVGLTINGTPIGTVQKNYPRISPDPTIGLTKAYIDIGVYEYQKQPLLKPGNEVDILWVSTKERPENGVADGSTWSKPTSDLQRAINTLLQSRNGHKKEIRIMEGEYAPVTPQTIEGVSGKVNAFVIDTKSLNASAIVPSAWGTDAQKDKYFAQSLTIKGGYSSEIMYEYDPVKYKTVIRQKEAADGSNDDHLIYVADPTVRYYYNTAQGYTDNNDGATWSTSSSAESYTARTMPIQIDGVTLINNMAEAGIAGSAIYYPEQATTMTQAHSVSVDAELTYYTDASHETKSGHDGKDETDFPLIEGGKTMNDPAKIVITKTQVVGSGKPTTLTEHDDPATASAVYIGKYGGHALIYNTVFHSNFGMPLNAYNTVNVNNTFGLNAGKVQLNDVALASGSTPYVTSEMHNSALWKNNETSTKGQYGAQVYFGNAVAAGSAKFTYNSYTGATADATNHLTSLDDLNSNIGEGPNFVDPENADIESRNFDIKPSMRLLNQGNNVADTGLYYDKILHYDLGYTIEVDGQQVEQYANYDYALSATTDVDVMNRPRFKSVIDLGAYEFQGSLYDVLYVDPNKSHSNDATGENWDSAFGYGDLQNAVDLAAIYHATTPSKEAYVFVKGNSSTNKELNTNETLIIRDGVTAYGSIISSYNEWHGDTKHAGNVSEYIKDMTSIREGVASEAASKTIVTGIKVDDNASYNGGTSGQFPALVDGFLVTNPNTSSTPVVDIISTSKDAVIVVRNVVVADNNVTGGADVAKISNGLIYEALFRDNATTGAVLRVSNVTVPAVSPAVEYTTKGYAVNVTVEGKTVGADDSMPVDGNDGAEAEKKAQIYNSITNSITVPAASASGAYGSIKNQHISGYFYNIADPNLNYQLTETSKYIDMCDQTVNPMTTAGATNLVQFINYDTDRDILGNPRTLAGVTDGKTVSTKTYLLDRGAFETWKVKNTKNAFFCGESGTISTIEPYKTNSDDRYSFIKKHFYPHDGSVCYIMEGQTLVIDPFDPTHEVKATPHNPGFMLVQKGANFYGNGRPATCAYLAIERDVKQGGSIISIPYAMKYNENVSKPMYDSNGYLVQLDNNVVSAASEYNGLKRSDWKYIFQNTETSCWTAIGNTAVTAANHGVLLEAKSNNFSADPVVDKVTLRFTGQGTSMTDYIYTEDGVSKNVLLTKYDDVVSTNNGADYTDELDMGWNCFGLPYLVSSYKPYQKVSVGSGEHDAEMNKVVLNPSGEYSMNIPHTLWLYYDGTQAPDGTTSNPTMGDGGYYNVNSWESTTSAWHVSDAAQPSIWVGEGIFTQTATLDDTESLKFWLPIAPTMNAEGGANAKAAAMFRYYVDATGIVETEAPENVELIATEYYTPGGVRINKPQRGYVTIIRKVYSNGFVKIEKQLVR